MEDDARMSELGKLIFGKEATIPEEITANFIPFSLLSEDFSDKLAVVLRLRKYIISLRWKDFLRDEYCKILSSNKKYLECVISACFCEHECNQNVFDAFISVCALVTHFSEETLGKTGVDIRDLNPDIIMVFYRNVLKKSFLTQRGQYPFVEYIYGHKYLQWYLNRNDHISSDDIAASVFLVQDEKINEELNRYLSFQEISSERESAMEEAVISMVNEVLSSTSVKLPALPSEPGLIARLVASKENDIMKKADINIKVESAFEASRGYSSSNSDVESDYFAERRKDIAWHENIVQAVIRHNHSKGFGHENADSQIREVERIEKKLKDTMNSLIDILDECDDEYVL